ncbi:MAG: hypothetical protein LUE29_01985 [Lachnospiraceae bacterium]|nr:hypothetical protein [Lachnospiraceae bacterium]
MKAVKKVVVVMTVAVMFACLAACGDSSEENSQVITRDTSGDDATTTAADTTDDANDGSGEDAENAADEAFSFVTDGVTLTPGTILDLSGMPDANDIYTVQSCAIEGMDNVYMYDAFELTAFEEDGVETIYSVYFTDANITTPEGLALGDDVSLVTELYGDDYEGDDTQITYTKGNTELVILLQDDVVISIEYLMVLE